MTLEKCRQKCRWIMFDIYDDEHYIVHFPRGRRVAHAQLVVRLHRMKDLVRCLPHVQISKRDCLPPSKPRRSQAQKAD